MIINALVDYYDHLAEKKLITRLDWTDKPTDYALVLDDSGRLVGISDLRSQGEGKKKIKQTLNVPQAFASRSGKKPPSNFLHDKGEYFLRVDSNDYEKFEDARKLHHAVLDGVEDPGAKAVLAYFDHFDASAFDCDKYQMTVDDLKKSNFVFWFGNGYVHDRPEIQRAWRNYKSNVGQNSDKHRCLITGNLDYIPEKHPKIGKVMGGNPSGVALISANADAYTSYGQPTNARGTYIGLTASKKYTAALNYLLGESEHRQYIGESVYIYWAASAENAYQLPIFALFNSSTPKAEEILSGLFENLAQGKAVEVDGVRLNPEERFYIASLSPNGGRLGLEYMLDSTFGALLTNIKAHYDRLEIIKNKTKTDEHSEKFLSPYMIACQTVRDPLNKKPEKGLTKSLIQAIMTNQKYPEALLVKILQRIQSAKKVRWKQAAIIKAFLIKNRGKDDLTMALQSESNSIPYTLGRLFADCEQLQWVASGRKSLNKSIRDAYFNAAMATPARVFPHILGLAQKHLHKVSSKEQIYFDKKIGSLLDKLDDDFPKTFDSTQQGEFVLGFYHQQTENFKKSEK